MIPGSLKFVLITIAVGWLWTSPLRADDLHRAQITAATASALENLRADIGTTRIQRDITVDQFVKITNSSQRIMQVLERARQIGEPRWIDDKLVQVQLEVPGDEIARALVEIAADHPGTSPISSELMARELRGWKDRAFSATGSSLSAQRLEILRPTRFSAWNDVDEQTRQRVMSAARQDAMRRALDSLRAIQIEPELTVGDVLAHPAVAESMTRWFAERPAKTVAFHEDLQIELTLAAPADEAFEAFRSAIQNIPNLTLPEDEPSLDRLREEFTTRMAAAVGRAGVTRGIHEIERAAIELPAQAPEWVDQLLDAEGSADGSIHSLHTKRHAESKAMQNLRAKIGALALSAGMTIDDAAKRDPRLADAVERAMVRARVFKVDYDSAGKVMVKVTIDPRDVWDDISRR